MLAVPVLLAVRFTVAPEALALTEARPSALMAVARAVAILAGVVPDPDQELLSPCPFAVIVHELES